MRVLFVTQYDERGASSRCRVYQYLPHLAARGIAAEVVPKMPTAAELWRQAGAADAVYFQKRVPPLAQLLLLRRRGPRLLFDFDDAIWLRRGKSGAVRPAPLHKRLRLAATLRLADMVVAGNEYLAAYARRWTTRIAILPTPIDADYYAADGGSGVQGSGFRVQDSDMGGQVSTANRSIPSPQHLLTPSIRLGWVGHPENLCYLRRLEPALAALARRFPGLSLRVVCSEPYESGSLPVENVPWSLEQEVANLRSFDIGLMPLDDDPWTRGKCAYKALQYMAVGVPVVASPVGMNADVITEGENGLLAADLDAWERQLARLVESPELRQRLGGAGRRSVEEQYSLPVLADRLAELLTSGSETRASLVTAPDTEGRTRGGTG